MIGHCFALHNLVAFQFCNHLAEEEIAGCFTFIALLLLSFFGALCLFLTVSWVGLQCVIVKQTRGKRIVARLVCFFYHF